MSSFFNFFKTNQSSSGLVCSAATVLGEAVSTSLASYSLTASALTSASGTDGLAGNWKALTALSISLSQSFWFESFDMLNVQITNQVGSLGVTETIFLKINAIKKSFC